MKNMEYPFRSPNSHPDSPSATVGLSNRACTAGQAGSGARTRRRNLTAGTIVPARGPAARTSAAQAGCLLAGGLGAALAPQRRRQGQVGHSDFVGRRPAANGHFRSKAGGGSRLLRSVEQTDPHQRARNPGRRNAPVAGAACRQVLIIRSMTHGFDAHETAAYIDPRRDGRRRPIGLSRHGRGGFAV